MCNQITLDIGPVITKIWKQLSNQAKRDWGEYIVTACLECLGLRKNKDYIYHSKPVPQLKIYYPEFIGREFAIEVKNLSRTTEVWPMWIKDHVLNRFPEHYTNKILVIFGGKVFQQAIDLLKQKGIFFIHGPEPVYRGNLILQGRKLPYEQAQPVYKRNFRIIIWWLKDQLLKNHVIRREVVACNARFLRPLRQNLLVKDQGKEFLQLSYDTDKNRFTLTTFARNSTQKRTWIIHWREVEDLLRVKKVRMFNWKRMDKLRMKPFQILQWL